MKPVALLILLLFQTAPPAYAQWTPQAMRHAAAGAPDLQFPSEPSPPSLAMGIFKPDGAGPFPGLVLLHQCGGLVARGKTPNLSMLDWAKEAVAHGYVAFLLDSLTQRNASSVCEGAQMGVNFPRGVKDVLQAAERLRALPYVDKSRIALAGFSWGAMIGLLADSKSWEAALAPGAPFDAVVSFYPGCATVKPPSGAQYELVEPDIDRPLLVLMGEADTETPSSVCIPKLEAAKAAGAPVEWHVYPKTTHCFDCRQLNGFTKTVGGRQVVYTYDEKITEDAGRRIFGFIEKSFGR
ncbi:MAG TPA: dienelactone hydrolase family protein [Candidatus Binatia bacterium]|jgi:dienelactone hydrolase